MPLEEWIKLWMYMLLGCLVSLPNPARTARPRFDTSTDMGLVLVPADAEIDSVIFRLRATDQDADFPLLFDITATVTPVVRIENLPCTLYNKICQANVILTKRLIPGRLHDFAVRVRDSKGDSNSMQATISVTNATTQRDKMFPHIPAIIMVPEDAKPGKELDYVLVRSNQWSGKPVYIELWQPKELFTIRQRQTPAETRGVITLIGELDFETQSMYTLTMYATDPYTEPKKDTRNIAGLHLVVIVQDVQDVPPIFTLAPPLTKINNTVQPGDVILRVHAEDGDKGVPREVTYGLVSEGNPFTPFFNISETTGEITLARPLEELTQITHVGAPVVLSVVAEEIRRSTGESPAQASVVEVGLLLGEPGNSPPFFENDNYVAWIDENAEPGSVIAFTEHYSTKVRDEDIGKAGVFALKLENNNGTFEISPAVAERTANFIITIRDNSLIDYEIYKSLRFKIIAQEVGPATNLSAIVPATIFIRDVNDNPPEFEETSYEVTLSENVTAGTRVIQVRATDKDTGSFGRIQYTSILGPGNEALSIDPDTGIITVAMGNLILDREKTPNLQLTVEARDEDGKGLRGIVPLIVNLLDVNDNAPIFEKESYEFTLNEDSTNFTMPAIIKAFDADSEPPNNEIRYEIVHGNYENKFYLNEITGELFLREPINKVRRTRHNLYETFATKFRTGFVRVQKTFANIFSTTSPTPEVAQSSENSTEDYKLENSTSDEKVETLMIRKKRENDDVIFTLTARAYDLGVPHMSGVTQVNVMKGPVAGARIVSFVVPGENPNPIKTAETLAAITGGRITVQEIRPYTIKDVPNGSPTNVPSLEGGKKSIVVARVEPNDGGSSLVDIERIRAALAANGVGVIGGDMSSMETGSETKSDNGSPRQNTNTNTNTNINVTSVHSEEVTVYKAENKLLFWLLIILGLLMLLALIALIICCICPGCPFYMAPRKRRVHSSETLIARSDGRPKRHLHRKHARLLEESWPGKKQAWSADPTRRNWQFNRRNQKALASLPGDVHVIDQEHEILEKAGSLRLRDGPVTIYPTDETRRPEEERIYIEDVEGLRGRGYIDVETIRQQDMERGLEYSRQPYINREERGPPQESTKLVREQHFYRDGNAEVLRLVTRGQIEEGMIGHNSQRPQTLVIEQEQTGSYRNNDGKNILLQRFIEDQKIRHSTDGQDLHDSFHDIEHRSMESHQRQKELVNNQVQQQQKILLIPERLEDDHRQHIEELGPEVQRLIIDHGSFEKVGRFEVKDSQELIQGSTLLLHAPHPKISTEKPKENTSKQNINLQTYSIHDLELARQNALLTRLLLERDGREVGAGAMVDSASYLETQSLPGQVAIATQTDRTASTQTELPNRSRSDNDESEEEARMRKKLKSKKRYAESEPRKIRTLWIKSPIEEEEMQQEMEKRTNILRKKMREVKETRRISLEPEVLREISDSLDENGDSPITVRERKDRSEDRKKKDLDDSNSKDESRNEEGRLEDSSSMELEDGRRIVPEKRQTRADEDTRRKSNRAKRENVVEPSFRILEKEMSSLSKKLSKLAGKKMAQYSNESETDERGKKVMTSVKKIGKKAEVPESEKGGKTIEATKSKRSKSTLRTAVLESGSNKEQTKIREEIVDTKTRQTSKYRKSKTISTGSSDFEEVVEKVKKPSPSVTKAEKQRQTTGKSSQVKLKRQTRVEHKEQAKSAFLAPPQDYAEGKDTSDTASKGSIQSGKSERDSMRMKRYIPGTIEGKSGQTSSSQSSDNLIDKKIQRKERAVLSKKKVVETSETSGKMSQEEIGKAVEGTVIEIKGERPVVPELNLKIVPEILELQKSEIMEKLDERSIDEKMAIMSPDKSREKRPVEGAVIVIKGERPVVPELNLKIVPEILELQRSEIMEKYDEKSKISSAKSHEKIPVERTVIEIKGESFELENLKIVPEIMELQKSEIIEKHDERSIDETSGKIPQEEMAKVSSDKSDEKSPVERTIIEINEEIPAVPELSLKIVPETVELQKSKIIKKHEEKSIDEATRIQTSDDLEERKSFDTEKYEVLTIPMEKMIDFLAHEMRDSSQALQGHYHSISEGAEKIKDLIFGSVAMESVEEKIPDVSKKETISETIELKQADPSEEWREVKTDISKPKQKFVRGKNVDQESEDGGMFSDNFDSFCGTDMHLKNSMDGQTPNDEISYETLQSESSEEQIAEDKIRQVEVTAEKGGTITAVDEPAEKSTSPQILTIKETPESPKSPEIPSSEIPSDQSPKKAVSPSPVSHESITTEVKTETVGDDSIQTTEIKSVTNVTIEKPIDTLKDTEELDLKSVIHVPLAEGQTEQLPVDALKGSAKLAKSPEIERQDLTAVEDNLRSVQGQTDQLTIDASKVLMESPKSPEIPQLSLKPLEDSLKSVEGHLKSVQGVLKSVEGQADQLMTDASKILKESAKSPEMPQLSLKPVEDSLKSVEGHLKSVQGVVQSAEDQTDQLMTDASKILIESAKSPEMPQLSLKPVEDTVKSVEGHLKSVQDVVQSVQGQTDQLMTDASKILIETAKSPEMPQLSLKPVKDTMKSVGHLKSVQDVVQSVEGQTDQLVTDASKVLMEHAKSPTPDLKPIDHSKLVGQIDQVPIVPPLEIKILDEKVSFIDEPRKPMPEIKSPTLLSPSNKEIILEKSPQKEFGIADSLFVDAKFLELPADPEKMAIGKYVKIPQEKRLNEEKSEIVVKPVNLVEFSHSMLEDPDDSDSSEASSKTMLTARPYGTPRHRRISEDIKTLEVGKEKSTSLVDPEYSETKEVPIKTTSDSGEVNDSTKSPGKLDKISLPDKPAEQVRPTMLELHTEVTPNTSVLPVEKKVPERIQPSRDIVPVEITSEATPKEPEKPIREHGELTKKLETTGQEEDAKEATTEKVQELNQIRQETLPADADGFVSLPETDKPVKIMEDSIKITEETPLDEEMSKLPVEIMKGDDKHSSEEPETEAKLLSPTGKGLKKFPGDIIKRPDDDHAVQRVESGAKFVPSAGKEEKKLPVEIMKGDDDDHVVKKPGTEAKSALASTAKETKGIVKKKDQSKEDPPRGVKKVLTTSSKTPLPKKEQKVKTLKEESSKIAKQATVVEKLTRPKDSNRQARPAQPKMEEVADTLSRTDRVRRTWRKTDRPDKDQQQEEGAKMEKFMKIPLSGDDGKLIGKRSSEARAKREKLKDSRVKKIQEKTGKLKIKKSISVDKIDESTRVEEIDRKKMVEDLKDFDEKDVEKRDQRETVKDLEDHSRKDVERIVDLSKEDMEKSSIVQHDESMAPSLVQSSVKLEDEDKEIAEEKRLLEEKEISKETGLEVPISMAEKIETKSVGDPPKSTEEQDPVLAKETVKSIPVSKPVDALDEPSASEIDVPTEKKESESITDEPKAKIEEKLHDNEDKTKDSIEDKSSTTAIPSEKSSSPRKAGKHRKETEMVGIESQSRYMEWYKLKREEMERKRQERKDGDEEEERPKWLRKSTRQRWFKGGPDERKIFDPKVAEMTPSKRRKIKPLVNVESEQLKAIVRQGRKLRKAQGEKGDEPQIEIFAPEMPPTPLASVPINSRYHHHHHLLQHSEYKYEKMPFYLHPPPVPHTSPQISPHNFEDLHPEQYSSLPTDSRCPNERYESGIIHQQQQQGGSKLRHGQLLEKKSVFDIAYSEAAPSQLRSDSTTPPS